MIIDHYIRQLNNRANQSIPLRNSTPFYLVFPQCSELCDNFDLNGQAASGAPTSSKYQLELKKEKRKQGNISAGKERWKTMQ